jgi:hypothetical protein
MRNVTAFASAVALVAAPTVAAPAFAASAPTVNPASSLSITRAATPGARKSKLAGGAGIAAALLAAGVVAIGVVAIVNDNDNSASN